MIRILMVICVVTAAAWAAASPSARLAALADDGLLIEDAGADGLWPASVAEHGSFGAFRVHGFSDDLTSMGWDLRRPLGRGVTGRLWADACPENVDGQKRLMLQTAKAMAAVSLGVGVYFDGPVGDEQGTSGRRGLQVGLRWQPDRATVLEGTFESGGLRADNDEPWDGSGDEWRIRGYRDIGRGFILTGGAERRTARTQTIARGIETWRENLDTDSETYEFGLLFWPDADTQLGFLWVDRRLQGDTSNIETPGSLKRREIDGEHGLKISVEVRPSAWFSFRSGFGYFHTGREVEHPTMYKFLWGEKGHSARLGCGGSVHAGRFDVNLAWANGAASSLLFGAEAEPDADILHCEIVAAF